MDKILCDFFPLHQNISRCKLMNLASRCRCLHRISMWLTDIPQISVILIFILYCSYLSSFRQPFTACVCVFVRACRCTQTNSYSVKCFWWINNIERQSRWFLKQQWLRFIYNLMLLFSLLSLSIQNCLAINPHGKHQISRFDETPASIWVKLRFCGFP